jgi:adenylosuccinate lyase
MALFFAEFARNRERLHRAVENISFGKFSGAVGTFSNIDPSVEEAVCTDLGLKPDPVSTQIIQRDRHAEFMAALAIIAGSCDQLATELRHLQRTEVREVEEPFQKGQKGSSAMPHKRNPILCERISGLSRVIKANQTVALDNMTLWHERDISHSSAERVIFPDSISLVDYILQRSIFILENLHVYPDAMQRNLEKTGGLFFSQSILLKLIERGYSREESYALVQECAMESWNGMGTLRELIEKNAEASSRLTPADYEEIFDLNRYTRHIDYIFKRAGIE